MLANSDVFVLRWDTAIGTETYPQDTMMILQLFDNTTAEA